MFTILAPFIPVAIIALLVIIILASGYVTACPDEAIII